jgi:hypothetical protein
MKAQTDLVENDDFQALARREGWHVPPLEVRPIRHRAWQQAVFWGLRLYIVVMLGVMAVGFAHVTAGS